MSDEDKELKGIDDLLKESKKEMKHAPHTGGAMVKADENIDTPSISSEEVTEKFEKKMKAIRISELEAEAEAKARKQGVPYINLVGFPISDFAISAIPKKDAVENQIVCFYNDEKEVRVGAINPDEKAKDILNQIIKDTTFNGAGSLYLISSHSYEEAIKTYDRIPELKTKKYGVEITGEQLDELKKKVSDFGKLNVILNEEKNMTNIIAIIIAGALESGASDIHIEAEENKVILRFRIDGVMQQVATLEKKMWKRLDSRIKNIAGLKINIVDKPQDGRITIYLGETDKLELRVSTLPTAFGASIVMRLLKSSAASLQFEDLGIRGKSEDDLKKAVEKTTGMVITTGPTGSGKTTTLYAILNKLNDGKTKIITLEDPIELKIQGIAQSQISHDKGYGFGEGLRSLMRQDPDVIMVGEMRDTETVEVAIEAALTGHKVISTIHTNDAAGAVPRFLSMGAKPFLLAPALNAVIGQRLVRRIHEDCKIEFTPDKEQLKWAQNLIDTLPETSGYEKKDLSSITWHRGQGCDGCKHIGYKGRIGIYEIFAMNSEFEQLILSGKVSAYAMADKAKEGGMINMTQDGVLKAMDGITTIDEIYRVAA